MENELDVVFSAAVNYALEHRLTVPTLEQVKQAESSASGHADYGAKWVYRIVGIMERVK